MKKANVLIAVGAAVLSLSSFIATKANRNFIHVSKAAMYNSADAALIGTGANLTAGFTTVAASKHIAVLAKTNGSSAFTFLATLRTSASSTAKKVYR
jgi:hypothetical protein